MQKWVCALALFMPIFSIQASDLTISTETIDYGYANITGSGKIVVDHGNSEYIYNADGSITIPFQSGNGAYNISLYENIEGTKYSLSDSTIVQVDMEDEDEAFLHPNQYVNYNYKEMQELLPVSKDAYKTICDYIKTYKYDFIKASIVESGTLPNIWGCIKEKKGICQDLSALCVALLRSYGIPAKLVIGYADGNYHSWVETKNGIFDPTAEINCFKVKNYTPERYY